LPSDALRAMWEQDIAAGVNPIDDSDLLHPPAPGRVQVVEPLIRPTPPPADWRAEQVVAQRSANVERVLHLGTPAPEPEELAPPTAEALQARPAPRRRKGQVR